MSIWKKDHTHQHVLCCTSSKEMTWADEEPLKASVSPTSKSPQHLLARAGYSVTARQGIYSLRFSGCKVSFWTNLYKDPFSSGPLRSQMSKLHSGSQKDKRTSSSNKAAWTFLKKADLYDGEELLRLTSGWKRIHLKCKRWLEKTRFKFSVLILKRQH